MEQCYQAVTDEDLAFSFYANSRFLCWKHGRSGTAALFYVATEDVARVSAWHLFAVGYVHTIGDSSVCCSLACWYANTTRRISMITLIHSVMHSFIPAFTDPRNMRWTTSWWISLFISSVWKAKWCFRLMGVLTVASERKLVGTLHHWLPLPTPEKMQEQSSAMHA